MYKLLIETIEGDRRIHALRYADCRIMYEDEDFVIERYHAGEWRLDFTSASPVSWRLLTEDGTELQEGRWYPFSHRGSELEGGQG